MIQVPSPSSREAEAEDCVQGQPELIERLHLKTNKQQQQLKKIEHIKAKDSGC